MCEGEAEEICMLLDYVQFGSEARGEITTKPLSYNLKSSRWKPSWGEMNAE